MQIILFSLLSTLFIQTAQATVYFTAIDPDSGSTALVYSSSGGNFWQTLVKGRGMIGAQASGLCGNATPQRFLDLGMSAEEVGKELKKQCDSVNWYPYRLSIVTVDGAMSSLIAPQGCHSGNVTCGNRRLEDFLITGGGLEAATLDAATEHWKNLDRKMAFHCKLYSTLQKIYAAGGEIKEFAGASIAIDDPNQKELIYWSSKGSEKDLLPEIQSQMARDHYSCN